VPFGQGYKDLSPAVDVLERLVEEGKLHHANHPVLSMAAANAKVELDAAGNRKLSKRRSIGRIDPLVALCMGLGVAARPAPASARTREGRADPSTGRNTALQVVLWKTS
jgi:phage terminase large subunit-like protein